MKSPFPLPRAAIVLAGLSLLLLVPFVPGPARASCQTAWCQESGRLENRQREAEARAVLAEDPTDVQSIRVLLGLLHSKSYRERAIADYRMTYTWEPPPSLDGLEEQIAADRRTWEEVLARLEANDPKAWCDYARSLPTPEERLEALRNRLAREPAAEQADPATEAELTACLGRELAAQGRRAEAIDQLRAFLDRSPEPTAYRELRRLTDDATDRALFEEQASRRPDDFDSRAAQLRWLLRLHAKDQDVERGRLLATRLLETELTPAEHETVCQALDHHLPDAYRRCLRQLLATPYPDTDPETLDSIRDRTWQSLAFQAIYARDWPRFAWVLARIPEEQRPHLWNRAVEFTRGDFCPQFLTAYDQEIPRSTERSEGRANGQNERRSWELAFALRACGADEKARELLQGVGLLRPDGSDPHRLDWIVRLRDHAPAHGGTAFPTQSGLANLPRTADDEVIAALERWAAEAPEAFHPWLYLAAIHDAEGDTDKTIASWQAALARRPDDLDLHVALGAVALRLERHDLVREVAERLRSDPAANARHRAEADYLLGRIALREGRWNEASDRLERYFLRRLRFTGCSGIEQCDRGLVAHLDETGDQKRLNAYLEHALAARKAYESPLAGVDPGDDRPRHESLSPDQMQRIDRARRRTPDQGTAPVTTPIACTSPRLLDHLRERLDAHPGDPDLQRRLDEARSRRLCTPDELPGPETLFRDDELLGLSWRLREVS